MEVTHVLRDRSFWRDISDHIMEFNNQFSEAEKWKKLNKLLPCESSHITDSREKTGSRMPKDSKLFGRKESFDRLVAWSLGAENKEAEVMTILGMGGVGKTTLAQHTYRHLETHFLKKHLEKQKKFDLMGWVCVSEGVDPVGLTKGVLSVLGEGENGGEQLDPLQKKLSNIVKEKTLFLVLDDMPKIALERWESFFASFQETGHGSKILITSREEEVAPTAGVSNIEKLECLSEGDALSLFQQYANPDPRKEYPQELVPIGKDMVRRCRCLPSAVKLLANSLRSVNSENWGEVLEGNLFGFHENIRKPILEVLYYRYLQLPKYLKDCFKICSLFRRGEMIDKKELAQIWIAHDLITVNGRGIVYEKADNCISQLVSRSFFEEKWFGDKVRIHDLLYDLLEYICEENYRIDDSKNQELSIPDHVRHARVDFNVDGDWNFNITANNLRTLWIKNVTSQIVIQIAGPPSLRILYITGEQSQNMLIGNLDFCLQQSKLVHGFTYRDHMVEVPESLFKLYNLRRLDFSGSKNLMTLPNSVDKLKRLEHLDISRTGIKELPRGITILTKLQSLNLKDTDILSMPSGISSLTELRYLPYFPIGNVDDALEAGLEELKTMVHLSDELTIRNLQFVATAAEAHQCQMNGKQLRRLNLNWLRRDGNHHSSQLQTTDENILEELKPHTCIRELGIDGYAGVSLPSWMGDASFKNLKKVTLAHFQNCQSISSIQQLRCLDELHISNMSSVTEIVLIEGSEFFQGLKILKIVNCCKLKSILAHRFPALVELYVEQCAKLECIDFTGQSENLRIIPNPSLEKVVINQCSMLNDWVRRNRHSKLGHVSNVLIDKCNIISNGMEEKVPGDTGDTTPVDMRRLFKEILKELEVVDGKSLVIKGMHDDAVEWSGGLDVEWLRNLRSLAIMVEADLHKLLEYQHHDIRVESNSAGEVNQSLADPLFREDMKNRIKEFKQQLSSFKFIGRNKYLAEIMDLLLMEGSEVEVVAITGKGGVGKTALAKYIFQQVQQLNYFGATGWVNVSEVHFNDLDIWMEAMKSFGKHNCAFEFMDSYYRREKKLLLVLDNMQHKDLWECFFNQFVSSYGGKGSKILITTREPSVAKWKGVANHIDLACLNEEEGRSLFERHAFSRVPDGEKPPGLSKIGKGIVKKCGYLPLSLKVLGSFLRYERYDEDTWTSVLEGSSDQWDLVQFEGGSCGNVPGPLYFSYQRLPSHLQACLRFFCLFHRGESITRKELVHFWMAHDLISTDEEGSLQYRIAEKWIDELLSRAFLEIPHCSGDSSIVQVPELLYDILQYVWREEFQTMDANSKHLNLKPYDRHVRVSGNLQTVWIQKHPEEDYSKSPAVHSGSSLRVLTIHNVAPTNLDACLAESKLLRVLIISRRSSSTKKLPSSLFKLYNLIHLNLSGYQINELPESIRNLKNLRHLDVSYTELRRMPDAIVELTNLRSLYIKGNYRLAYIPRGLSRLKGLEELDCFVAGRTSVGEGGLQELADLVRDQLMDWPIFKIYGLQNAEKEDATKDDILLKIRCNDLSLYWRSMDGSCTDRICGSDQEVVLNKLRPHSCIQKLRMEFYGGSNLPAWLGDKSLLNLASVSLKFMHECASISCLGELPFLEFLSIERMFGLREVVSPVQSSSGSASTRHHILSFPKLTHLSISDCSSITCIPLYRFPALINLYIEYCKCLEKIEFSGSQLERRNDYSPCSIRQIVIIRCEHLQFPSEMAVPTSLETLDIYKCEKLSGWIRSNRSTRLIHIPEVLLDFEPLP